MRIGKVLQAYRDKERLSLRDLAMDIGIDPTTLHRLERGDNTADLQTWLIVTNWLAGK